jgi:hypothetical protein
VHFGGVSSTGELLKNDWVLTNFGALKFMVCFYLQDKYGEGVIKSLGEDYDWWKRPNDKAYVYACGGRKAHGWWDVICFSNL